MKSSLKPDRLLVVEDNPGDFFLIEDYLLEGFGALPIDHCKNFTSTRERLQSNTNYSVILLDLMLPELKGEDLVKEVLALTDIPIIILTGLNELKLAQRLISYGVSDYLNKDELNTDLLQKSILYAMERKRFVQRLRESSANYENLFQLSPQPKWIFDKQSLIILDANQAAFDLYGYSREEFIGMSIKKLRKKEDFAELDRILNRPDRDQPFKGTFTHQKKDGEKMRVIISSRNLTYQGIDARVVVATDITQQEKLQQEIITNTYRVEKKERERIAVDLHNGIQQTFVAAYMNISYINKYVNENLNDKSRKFYNRGLNTLKEGIDATRRVAHEMIPFEIEKHGLKKAIEALVEQNSSDELSFDLQIKRSYDRYKLTIEILIYRVCQEALNNILKHSEASKVLISIIEESNQLELKIQDNGKGFEVDDSLMKSFGMKTMRDMALNAGGEFQVHSSPGKGSQVKILLPLSSDSFK